MILRTVQMDVPRRDKTSRLGLAQRSVISLRRWESDTLRDLNVDAVARHHPAHVWPRSSTNP